MWTLDSQILTEYESRLRPSPPTRQNFIANLFYFDQARGIINFIVVPTIKRSKFHYTKGPSVYHSLLKMFLLGSQNELMLRIKSSLKFRCCKIMIRYPSHSREKYFKNNWMRLKMVYLYLQKNRNFV